MFKKKRLLILGAGRGQLGLYKAARELGVTTIAGTLADNYPVCLPFADEACFMNILDPDSVEEKTRDIKFDGVATCCLDKGLKALGRLCDKYQLPGYSESVAELCNNKLLMKQRFIEAGVNTAQFRMVSDKDELSKAIEEIGGYPAIIKATDLAGSMGIYIVNNKLEAKEGFLKSMDATQKNYVIVERYLRGEEFGAQAFIQNGNILFVMPHGDRLFHGCTDVPIGHYTPFKRKDEINSQIIEESIKSIKAVGLDNCAVNIDFIEENGKVYVLELSGRIGANGLPEVVSANYGINYYKMVVLAALGYDVNEIWKNRKQENAAVSQMIYCTDQKGFLQSISYKGNDYPEIFDIELFGKIGSEVHPFANSSHCLGQIVISAATLEQCDLIKEKVLDGIKINIKK